MINEGDTIVWKHKHSDTERELGLDPREDEIFTLGVMSPVHGDDIAIVPLISDICRDNDSWIYLAHLQFAIKRGSIDHRPHVPMEFKQKIKKWNLH